MTIVILLDFFIESLFTGCSRDMEKVSKEVSREKLKNEFDAIRIDFHQKNNNVLLRDFCA